MLETCKHTAIQTTTFHTKRLHCYGLAHWFTLAVGIIHILLRSQSHLNDKDSASATECLHYTLRFTSEAWSDYTALLVTDKLSYTTGIILCNYSQELQYAQCHALDFGQINVVHGRSSDSSRVCRKPSLNDLQCVTCNLKCTSVKSKSQKLNKPSYYIHVSITHAMWECERQSSGVTWNNQGMSATCSVQPG